MVANLAIVEEEADEAIYWIELIGESELVKKERLEPLVKEIDEVLAMTVASIKTARKKGG
jgi:four helix bundle protein